MKFRFNETISHISERAIEHKIQQSQKYVSHIQDVVASKNFEQPECSINAVYDTEVITAVNSLAEQLVTTELKYIFVIGIGGSNLGTQAIYEALLGYQDKLLNNNEIQRPRMIFIDTNNSRIMNQALQLINQIKTPDEILVNIITKSGGTAETIANAEVIINALQNKSSNFAATYKKRIVFTTNFNSKLWEFAQNSEYHHLGIRELIGGRYSVFSSVGLFPLRACGINIGNLLHGACDAVEFSIRNNRDNPALVSAILLAENLKRGKTINDNFIFNSELEALGKWYRQLMGESVGKQQDIHGKDVFRGITPTVSIGSTDLHSVGQLYLGGPKDKYTTFISAEVTDTPRVNTERCMPKIVTDVTGKSFSDIIGAILQGTQRAYINENLPFTEIIFTEINENELGKFLQFKMIEMMYLGHLLELNPFDQPNVELYKIETKKLLNKDA